MTEDVSENLTINDEALTKFRTTMPTYSLAIGGTEAGNVITITREGRVIVAPGVSLDEASLAFWRGMEQMAPGICQRILDRRKENKKTLRIIPSDVPTMTIDPTKSKIGPMP